MENHETLIDFVEKQMTLYNIEKNEINRKKIYKKCQRELEKLGYWQNAPKIVVGRNKTKTFNLGQINILKHKTEDYFLKLSPFNKKEIDEIIKKNIEEFEKEIDLLSKEKNEEIEEIEEFYPPIITKNDILEVMITTLFNEKYEIDLKLWQEDLNYIHQLEYISSPVEYHEFTCQNEFIIRNKRLKNPSLYVSKKNS